MSLFGKNLEIVGLGIEDDSPGPGTTTVLPDGIHLRWIFERERGFPWHGYYLLRRESDSGWRRAFEFKPTMGDGSGNDLQKLLDSFDDGNRGAVYVPLSRPGRPLVVVGTEGAEAEIFFEKVGTARRQGTSAPLVVNSVIGADDLDAFPLFSPQRLGQVKEYDLYGLSLGETSRLTLRAPPPRRYRRVRLRIGFLEDDSTRVFARQGDTTVEQVSMSGARGSIETVVLSSDRQPFSRLSFSRSEAVVLGLEVVFVLGSREWALADDLGEPQPIRLPITHPDYPAGQGPEDPSGDRDTARDRSFVLGRSFPNRVPSEDVPAQGTVDVTRGSPLVEGIGTDWGDELEGRVLQADADGHPHVVMRVLSAERLVLARGYAGPSRQAASYSLNPDPYGQLHDVLAQLVEGGRAAGAMSDRFLRPDYHPGGTVKVESGRTLVVGQGTNWSSAVRGLDLHVLRDRGTLRVEPGTDLVEGVGTEWADNRFLPFGDGFFTGLRGSLLEIDGHSRPYIITAVLDDERLRIHPPVPEPDDDSDDGRRIAGFRILGREPYRIDRVDSGTVLHLDRPYRGRSRKTEYVLRVPEEEDAEVSFADQRLLDLVTLGSLSPMIAQALGLHGVDSPPKTDPSGERIAYDYLLVADHDGYFEDRSVEAWANGDRGRSWLLGVGRDEPDLDAAITHDHRIEPAPPPAAPEPPTGYRLGDASRLLPRTGQPHTKPVKALSGLTWDGPAGGALDEFPLLYHVWRQFLGEGEAPSVSAPDDAANYRRLTRFDPELGEPGPVVVGRTPSTYGLPQAPSDWPDGLRFLDMVQGYGWYSYRISAIDIFGRHSARSEPAPWWRTGSLTHGAPPKELHPFAVHVTDDAAPPRPTDVEAQVLDPADPHVQRGDRVSAWRGALPEDRRDTLSGLRVRWRWTQGQMQQAPDTTRFQICYHPHRLNVLHGRITAVDPDGPDHVLVTTDQSLPASPRSLDGAHLRVGRRAYPIEWTQQARQDPLRVRVERLGPDGIGPKADESFVLNLPPDAGELHTDYSDPNAWDASDFHRVPVDDFTGQVLEPRLDGAGQPLAGDGAEVQGVFLTLPAGIDLSRVRAGLDHVRLPDDAGAEYYRIAQVRPPQQAGEGPQLWLAEAPQVSVASARWTIGVYERQYEVLLPEPTEADTFDLRLDPSSTRPVAYGHVGVTAHDVRDESSPVSAPAKVYRVQRTAPDPPPPLGDVTDTDDVFATPADYHGRSFHVVTWPSKDGHGVHVFRALDDAVFRRDRAIRVTRGGLDPGGVPDHARYFPDGMSASRRSAVADELNALAGPGDYPALDVEALGVLRRLPGNETVVVPDPDALEARRDELAARDWALRRTHGHLAPDDPVIPGAWSEANRQAVADALNAIDPSETEPYEGLSNRALRVLASLPGHSAAFTQVTTRPVAAPEDSYRDTLDGRARNRFFYRVAYVDTGGNRSALSPSGPPIHLPDVVRPPTPRVASHECTDGEVTLTWTSLRAPGLSAYRVHRADDAERARDTRLMATVHREFMTRPPSERPADVSWTDDEVDGGRTYYYRLTAEDGEGNVSRASPTYPVTAVDRRPPAPAIWVSAEWVVLRGPDDTEEPWPANGQLPSDGRPAVKLVWEGHVPGESFMLSRRAPGQKTWAPVPTPDGDASSTGPYRTYDREASPERPYVYRVGTVAPTGVAPTSYRVIAVSPPE